MTDNAVIVDYINGVKAEINLAFLCFEVVSFQTTLIGSIGCNTQSVCVHVLVDIRNSLQCFLQVLFSR